MFLSGCCSIPQQHLLQPAVRENQRHTRGGLSSSSSSRPPWCYPQDAQWLWHPGWGAGPQAVRLAASLCLLFKYVLSMQATEKPCFAFFWMVYYTGKKKITPILLIISALIVPHYNIVVFLVCLLFIIFTEEYPLVPFIYFKITQKTEWFITNGIF